MARRRCIVTSTDAPMAYETAAINLAAIQNPMLRLYAEGGAGEFEATGTLLRSTDYNPETQSGTWIPIATTGEYTSTTAARTVAIAGGPWVGWWAKLALDIQKVPAGGRVILEIWAEASTYETFRKTPVARQHLPHMLDDVFDTTSIGIPSGVAP